MSIVLHGAWPRIRPYLHVVSYDKDGGHVDPRIRIEFLGVPVRLAHELKYIQIACVACGRPVNPLRRREGDGWDRLYYAPCCPVAVRPACARSSAARDEYERFKEIDRLASSTAQQLDLFGR